MKQTHHYFAGVDTDAALDRSAAVGDHLCRIAAQLLLHSERGVE